MKNVVHLDYIHNTNLILDIDFNGRNYFFETSREYAIPDAAYAAHSHPQGVT